MDKSLQLIQCGHIVRLPTSRLCRTRIAWPKQGNHLDELKEREVAKWERVIDAAGPDNSRLARQLLAEPDGASRRRTMVATVSSATKKGICCLWCGGMHLGG